MSFVENYFQKRLDQTWSDFSLEYFQWWIAFAFASAFALAFHTFYPTEINSARIFVSIKNCLRISV